MLKDSSLYSFLDNNFDYLLVVDENEEVLYASQLLIRDCLKKGLSPQGKQLQSMLTKPSLDTFRTAMIQSRAGGRAIAALATTAQTDQPLTPLKAGFTKTELGIIFLFFGNKLKSFDSQSPNDLQQRAKELTCLYRVLEWIEISGSIKEFFTKLPGILSSGMLYPEEAVIFSTYQGREYGQKLATDMYISTRLIVGYKKKGEIRVGYLDERLELLPDEAKMLNEIGWTLSLALERKELRDDLSQRRELEEENKQRLQELEERIEASNRELEENRNKLSIANSYLDRVQGDWDATKLRLETMFKAIPDDVLLLDRDYKVVMTNREDVEEGTLCYQSFFKRDQPCENCRMARILRDKAPVTHTLLDGDRFLQVSALPIYNQEQEVEGILEFQRDVTREKIYEQQLQQADKLASLGELVSGIGHEINNPNQFIRGNVKILQQALEDILPIVDEYQASHTDLKIARLDYAFFREHIMTLVEDMAHGSERIKGIVDGLRTFVRKDDGLLVDNIDISSLIQASTRLVHNQIHKKADINLELTPDLPTFTGNAQKLEQVLINLMVNASDAMREEVKGQITLRTSLLDGKAILIELEDNGMGMTNKTLKQIFDPFFTTKRARGGTGLGLAISYRIIEEHGGTITVNSQQGEGTTFRITIPLPANVTEEE
ncbi:PAS domain-containing protein [bacterium]|nr:PAS domain-containing protein [bacterium]